LKRIKNQIEKPGWNGSIPYGEGIYPRRKQKHLEVNVDFIVEVVAYAASLAPGEAEHAL
jgi:hypothetical protein